MSLSHYRIESKPNPYILKRCLCISSFRDTVSTNLENQISGVIYFRKIYCKNYSAYGRLLKLFKCADNSTKNYLKNKKKKKEKEETPTKNKEN